MKSVSTRDVLRKHKAVFEGVKSTGQPTTVEVNRDEPQVAIVSLHDLEALQSLRLGHSARTLEEAAWLIREMLGDERLPSDLALRHDAHGWERAGHR